MRKLVNGKVVNIENIELFEKAAEGALIGKLEASRLSAKLTVESDMINKCITHYEVFYKAMPFPLYYLENNVKYAAVATFIRDCMEEKIQMWVDEALFIYIDEWSNTALKMVGNAWGVVNVGKKHQDNTSIENFKDEIGYTEFSWMLEKIRNKENTSSFYREFMPDFVNACNNQPMVMRWELTNILTLGVVPNKMDLPINKVINLDNGNTYLLDTYSTGMKKTGEKEYVLSLVDRGSDLELRPKYVKVYDYQVYIKEYDDEGISGKALVKVDKSNLIGLRNLFKNLASIRIAEESNGFEDFQGFIADTDMVYNIGGRLYVCKAYKQSQIKEVARGVEIYAYDRGLVYFVKTSKMRRGITKEMIYSCSLRDGTLRLCKIQFVI